MSVNKWFSGKFLQSKDLSQPGAPAAYDGAAAGYVVWGPLTVRAAALEQVGDGKTSEMKPVLRFHELQQGFVCNQENTSRLSAIWGEDEFAWFGRQLYIGVEPTTMGGKPTVGLRVRVVPPQGQAAPQIAPPQQPAPYRQPAPPQQPVPAAMQPAAFQPPQPPQYQQPQPQYPSQYQPPQPAPPPGAYSPPVAPPGAVPTMPPRSQEPPYEPGAIEIDEREIPF